MKILLVSPHSEFNNQLKRAFAENGAQIIYLDDRKNYFIPGLLRGRLIWKITRRIPYIRKQSNELLNEKIMELCRQHRPDFLFTGKGMNIKASTISKVKSMGIKTVTWFMENTYQKVYFNWFSNNYQNYDYVFTNDSYMFENFFNKSSAKLCNISMTINPDYYKVQSLSKKDIAKYSCDVCFVGAFDNRREKILGKIKEIEGLNLKIFGWKRWKKSVLAPLYHGPLNLEGMAKLYRCAKICLNVNGVGANAGPVLNGVSLKTFEIPASGGFQLSDYRKDVDSLFKAGEEVEIYRSDEELIDKIKFYLDNEEARNKIAGAGHKRVLADHTLVKRVKDILTFIQSN